MLTGKTYTPDLEAEAAILPGVPPHLRAQLAREQARLLEMARSVEKAEAAGPVIISISGRKLDNFYFLGIAEEARLAGNGREQPLIRSLVAAS